MEGELRSPASDVKTRTEEVIPIAGTPLQAIIERRWTARKRHPACVFVFHRRGKRIACFRRSFKSACLTAGITPGRAGKTLHDFRRTGVANLIDSGCDEREGREAPGVPEHDAGLHKDEKGVWRGRHANHLFGLRHPHTSGLEKPELYCQVKEVMDMLHGDDALLFTLHVVLGHSLSEVARIMKQRKSVVLERWRELRDYTLRPLMGESLRARGLEVPA